MKKIISLLLASLMSFGLFGCGGAKKDTATSAKKETKQESKKEEKKEEAKKEEVKKEENNEEEVKNEKSKIEPSDTSIKLTMDTLKQDSMVKDVYIKVDGEKILIPIQVNAATNEDKAKDLIDTAIRQLASHSGGKTPNKDYYGELWDNYTAHVRIFSGKDTIIIDGLKSAGGTLKYTK